MKKLFLLAIVSLSLSSCSILMKQPMRTISVYDRQYFTPGEAVKDIYAQIASFGLDSIPLKDWITLEANTPDTYVLQRTVRCAADAKTGYRFIYTIFDSNRYVFKILCDTKEKKGVQPAKCKKVAVFSNTEPKSINPIASK
jgi:hypothetical protein